MASLKEIKNRINSVSSTQKITSAMKMIASSKLHKAQGAIQSFLPYQRKLDAILNNLLSADTSFQSPYTEKRVVKRIAIVAFASNSSLCGAYNANVLKGLMSVYNQWSDLGEKNILIYPVGKKIFDGVSKRKMKPQGDFRDMADKPSYAQIQVLAKELIGMFLKKEIDEVVLIYHHFKSMGAQVLNTNTFLPFELKNDAGDSNFQTDYILEPSRGEILETFIPTVLYSRLFASLLDANASEHAARTVAMQIATDNASDLNHELKKLYNKTRQQAVTNELLDIIGGASALQ